MSKYSVMLVDDEEFVFEVMMKKIDWESIGFHIDGYARNGVEALEMAEDILPDVVMTDIKMPYMDGLELTRKLKQQYPGIKVIIFSGFDDFEFAKEAIRLEAEEYILKPIQADELAEVFKRVKSTLDKELSEKRNIDRLEQYYMNSLPVLQDNFYISLIEGRVPAADIPKLSSDYQINLDAPYFLVSVLKIGYQTKTGEEVNIAPFMLSLSVQQVAEERLAGPWNTKLLMYLGELVAVTKLERKEDIRQFTDDMERLCRMAEKICKCHVTAGIGYVTPEADKLNASYAGAKMALSHKVLISNVHAINVEELQLHTSRETVKIDDEYQHRVRKAMRLGDEAELRAATHEFCAHISGESVSLQAFNIAVMKFSVSIFEFTDSYGIDIRGLGENGADPMDAITGAESIEALEENLYNLCSKIMAHVTEHRQDSATSFVTNAQRFIEDNYADFEMSIDKICSYLNISATYFSTAFKKATGKTFITYLTDIRMVKAKELLDTTDLKTYEIAEKVGYADPNYFSYAFKKQYGTSPSKYRTTKEV